MSRYANNTVLIQDSNGRPITGAYTHFYEPGTTTYKSIYSDENLTITQANPVRSLAGGYLPDIFIDGLYKVNQSDENDVMLWPTLDPVGEIVTGQFEAYNSADTYLINEIVLAANGSYYISLVSANQGNEPSVSASQWQLIPVKDMASVFSPKIDQIADSSGNEIIIFDEVANAVNEVTVTNAATGNAVSIAATGGDTDIGIDITPKGAGAIKTGGIKQGSVTAGITADVGSIQGGSPLTSETNEVSICATAGDSVTLPTAVGGQTITIINNGATACDVFPASGDDLGAGVNVAASLSAGISITYVDYNATNWEAPTERPTLILLSSAVASASATVEFTGLSAAYDLYVVELINVTPATDGTKLNATFSVDGGATWETDYTSEVSAAATFLVVTDASVENTTAQGGICGNFSVYNPSSTSVHTHAATKTAHVSAVSGFLVTTSQSGKYDATTAVDGVQFIMDSGLIASGEFKLYGVK